MAENRNENPNQQVRPLKKADLIIRYERDLSLKEQMKEGLGSLTSLSQF